MAVEELVPGIQYFPQEVTEQEKALTLDAEPNWSPEQRAILDVLEKHIEEDSFPETLCIGGYAGTGKTTLVTHFIKTLGEAQFRTACVSFTGKAVSVLRRKLSMWGCFPTEVSTIHKLIYTPVTENNIVVGYKLKNSLDDIDIIIVDEASMVSEELLADILYFQKPVILVGDHGQLPPVEGFNRFMLNPEYQLTEVHRQALDSPILRLATDVRKKGLPYLGKIKDIDIVSFIDLSNGLWLGHLFEEYGLHDTVVLTYSNRKREEINQMCLAEVHLPGIPMVCLRNKDPIFNGMRGVCTQLQTTPTGVSQIEFPYEGLMLRARLSLDQFHSQALLSNAQEKNPKEYFFHVGYAMTVHKSQGSAFKHVIVVLGKPPMVSDEDYRRWLYTAITRASDKLTLVM